MTNKESISANKIIWYRIISGTIFMIITIAVALSIKCPTEFQRWVFRVCLAIASGAYASIIPGFLKVKYQGFISAGGGLAVFVIVFLLNPDLSCNDYKVKGIVFVNNKIQKHVDVRLLEFRNSAVTDDYGYFEMSVPAAKIENNALFSFVFNYMAYVDTTIMINNLNIKQVLYFKLTSSPLSLKIIQKDSSNKIINVIPLKYIFGRIVEKDGSSAENAIVSYIDKECNTNTNGYFRLKIPDNSPETIQFQIKNSKGISISKITAINTFNTFKIN